MHLRRALLLMAVVLIVAAAVQALVPVPRTRDQPLTRTPPPAPPPRLAVAPSRAIDLRYPPRKKQPEVTVKRGTHLILRVSVAATGQVGLPGLGLVQSVEPGTPAMFDLLASRPGRYEVVFQPVLGGSARIGRVIVSGSGRRP